MSENGKPSTAVVKATVKSIQVDQDEQAAMAGRLLPMWQKDLDRDSALELARLAILYGLDPFAGEIIPYRGRPYITTEGRLRKAHETGKFAGIIEDRPATPDEYKALRVSPNDYLWYVSIKRSDWIKPNGRFGRFRSTEQTVTHEPELMARNRALRRALREAFPMSLPGIYEDEDIETRVHRVDDDAANMMATEGQIAAIHALAKQLELDDATYRQWLLRGWGVKSSKELTEFQADDVIRDFEEKVLAKQNKPQMDDATYRSVSEALAGTPEPEKVQEKSPPHPRKTEPARTIPDRSPGPAAYCHNPVQPPGVSKNVWDRWCAVVAEAQALKLPIYEFEITQENVLEEGKRLRDRIQALKRMQEIERAKQTSHAAECDQENGELLAEEVDDLMDEEAVGAGQEGRLL